ncbi:MAG TPA: SMP-30/gluconolactonase/LRE family protein [Steroidobacteraceae bacterium]|nr:SMP-30/gluconolactonase/LRE family protein [Steroidobacteraceae bacterium]
MALRTGLFRLAFDDGALTLLAAAPFDPARFRFNEGACDGKGRFWLGTMYDPKASGDASSRPLKGQWHSYSEHEGLRAHRHFAVVPNGLAWSADDRVLFTSHTRNRIIWVFDYELAAGRLGRRRVFARIPKEHGAPDGCAIDAEGCYWSALNGGSRLRRFRPDGSIDRDVMLPVSRPTMCAFGGAQLDTLYVTTQSDQLSEQERQAQPLAGKLLCVQPGVRGRRPGLFGTDPRRMAQVVR